MRWLGIIGAAAVLLTAGNSWGQQFFGVEICNESALKTYFVIVGKRNPTTDWTVEGFYVPRPGKCMSLGTFAVGKIGIHYRTEQDSDGSRWSIGVTKSEVLTQCVSSKAFTRAAVDPCPEPRDVRTFALLPATTNMKFVVENDFSWRTSTEAPAAPLPPKDAPKPTNDCPVKFKNLCD